MYDWIYPSLTLLVILMGIGVMFVGPFRAFSFLARGILSLSILAIGAYTGFYMAERFSYMLQNPPSFSPEEVLFLGVLSLATMLIVMAVLMEILFGKGAGRRFLERIITSFFYDVLKLVARIIGRILKLFRRIPQLWSP